MSQQQKKIKKAAAWKKSTQRGNPKLSVKVEFEDGSIEWVDLFEKTKRSEKAPHYATFDENPNQSQPSNNNEGDIPF